MSDIFQVLCEDVTNNTHFGICDDKPHQRAYIDTEDGKKWMAVVQNDSNQEVTFTALDNCIEFNKATGKKESRCEGVLTYNNTILFIEIKERSGNAKSWAKDADDQLRNSITLIESKINLDKYINKRAAIINRLQTRSNEKHTVRMKQFKEETGYVLRVNYRIVLD